MHRPFGVASSGDGCANRWPTQVLMKPAPVNPYESRQSPVSHPARSPFSDQSVAFTTYVRWVLVFAAIGFVALLASFLPVGDLRIVFGGIAYLGGLCLVSFGYVYASFAWRIPRLHWLGVVPPILLGLIYGSVTLLGPEHFDSIVTIIHIVWWAIRILVGLMTLCAIAGWFAYWHDRQERSLTPP